MGQLVLTEAQVTKLTSLVFDGTGQQELTIVATSGHATAVNLSIFTVNAPVGGPAGSLVVKMGVGALAPTGAVTKPAGYSVTLQTNVVVPVTEGSSTTAASSAVQIVEPVAPLTTKEPILFVDTGATPPLGDSANTPATTVTEGPKLAPSTNIEPVANTSPAATSPAPASTPPAATSPAPVSDLAAIANKVLTLLGKAPAQAPAYGKSDSFLFDASYYLLKHPDLINMSSISAVVDHFKATAANGSAPNAWFDPVYYASKWADLQPLKLTAAELFAHYNLYGVWEGRSAGAALDKFDGARYLKDNPDVAAYVNAHAADFLGSIGNGAIAHYVIYGSHEGRAAYDTTGLGIAPVTIVGTPGHGG
jgi:hypothetical protein